MYTAPINPAVMMGTMTGTDTTKQAAASGDFAAMLMQMFGGQGTDGTAMDGLLGSDSTMQYAQQLLAQQGDTDEQVQQDGTQNAMQMLSALFAATPADVSFVQSPMGYQQGGTQNAVEASTLQRMAALGIPTAAAQQTGYTEVGDTLASLTQGMTPEQLATFTQSMTPEQLASLAQTATTTNQTTQTTPNAQTVIGDTALQTQVLPPEKRTAQITPSKSNTVVLGTRTVEVAEVESASSQPKREVDPLMNAYNRLYSIQKPAEAGSKPTETIDIEAMQQAVDNGTYLNPSVATLRDTAATTEQVTPRDIASQVQTGIIANLDKEQKEFVIKLRPEGLGNITVKMVEQDGKISLSIITSTQQAQNALSSEISSLREALRPFNAEVTQLVANDMSFAQQQGMNEQRHDGYQGEQHHPGRFWEPEDNTTTEELQEYAAQLSSAMGTRI